MIDHSPRLNPARPAREGAQPARLSLSVGPREIIQPPHVRAHMVAFCFWFLFPRAYKISETPLFPKSPNNLSADIQSVRLGNVAWPNTFCLGRPGRIPPGITRTRARTLIHLGDGTPAFCARPLRVCGLSAVSFFFCEFILKWRQMATLFVRTYPIYEQKTMSLVSRSSLLRQLAEGCCLCLMVEKKHRGPLAIHRGIPTPTSSIPISLPLPVPASPLLNPSLPRRRWHQQRTDGTKILRVRTYVNHESYIENLYI